MPNDRSEYFRAYRDANRERLNGYNRKYYQAHKDDKERRTREQRVAEIAKKYGEVSE